MSSNTNTLSEQQLDNLVHLISNNLSHYGITLDSDLKCDLSDLLSDFLIERNDIEIVKDTPKESIIQIAFDIVSASVHQQARVIHLDYDEESIIEGLNSGALATTIGHEQGDIATISISATGETVAEILSQDINDSEYEDYR